MGPVTLEEAVRADGSKGFDNFGPSSMSEEAVRDDGPNGFEGFATSIMLEETVQAISTLFMIPGLRVFPK